MSGKREDKAYLDPLPGWISEQADVISEMLSKNGRAQFGPFSDSFRQLVNMVDQLPDSTTTFEIYKIDARALSAFFGDSLSALAHACEALIGRWAFQHAHKFASALKGFRFGLEDGNFLLSFSCARSMFEEVAHFHFFLCRFEASFRKMSKLLERQGALLDKGKDPSKEATSEYIETQLELIQRLVKALEGSDYDWSGWFKTTAESSGFDWNDYLSKHAPLRKTHINDCIRALEAKAIPAQRVYDLFSEMVHPNFGSNTLVVSTRTRKNEISGDLILSARPKNAEAAAWFFELAAFPLTLTFETEISCTHRAQTMLQFYMHFSQLMQENALFHSSTRGLRTPGPGKSANGKIQ